MKLTVEIEVRLELSDGSTAVFALIEPHEHGDNPTHFAQMAEDDMQAIAGRIKKLLEARYGYLPVLSRVVT